MLTGQSVFDMHMTCLDRIRELGSLPSDTGAKYQKTGVKEVGVACSVG